MRQPEVRAGFEDSEGLRALLTRLHEGGRGAWRDDPEVAALMRHAAQKYAALARKHGLDPWEAAAAAFDAMRNPSTRRAQDPWAMVTRAVQVTCIAEAKANGMLCSVHQARRTRFSGFHDAQRFSDRENLLTDYHPAFQTHPFEEDDDPEPAAELSEGSTGVGSAVEDAIALFMLLGWHPSTARAGVEYVCGRLAEASSRGSAFEALRRDYHARTLLGIPSRSWVAMLRAILGNPDPDMAHANAGRGVLLRLLIGEPLRALLIGEPLRALLTDDALLAEVVLSAPPDPGRRRG